MDPPGLPAPAPDPVAPLGFPDPAAPAAPARPDQAAPAEVKHYCKQHK